MPPLEYIRVDIPVSIESHETPPLLQYGETLIERYTVTTSDRQSVMAPLETMLPSDRPLVIVSPVRARVADSPPAFPFRVLAADPAVPSFVRTINSRMFRIEALAVDAAPRDAMEEFLRKNRWPTAEILHLGEPLDSAPLRMSKDTVAGTAGWLLRIADLWQTRLVIIEYDAMSRVLKSFACKVIDSGGPAVMLVPRGQYQSLYYDFIHDRPLDFIAKYSGYILFAGEGREELLRYSHILRRLSDVETAHELAPILSARTLRPEKSVLKELLSAASQLSAKLATTTFEYSEDSGFNPSKEAVDDLVKPIFTRVADRPIRRRIKKYSDDWWNFLRPREERHVNSGFFGNGNDDEVEVLDQQLPLSNGKPLHFSVQIGPADTVVKTATSTLLVEERFRWREQKLKGVEVEIAITGIDFDVLGAKVQKLWLPRSGATDRLFFTVTPRSEPTIPGVARLRFTIFYENNIVQSYRMAALTQPSERGASLLARALDVAEADIPSGVAWTSAIEYANASLRGIEKLPRRGLTIIANESGGEKVFTVKGDELFTATINNGVPGLVDDMRKTLRALSAEPGSPNTYRFRFNTIDNEGDPAMILATLFTIADLGWQLYSAIVQDADDRMTVESILGAREEIIHVADVKLGDIVPWSLLYDREIDPVSGAPHQLCDAAWPDADGSLAVKECRGPKCILTKNPDMVEETVVCPLRFWGYKHQIEVPVQQTTDKKATNGAASKTAKRIRPVKITAAVNHKLPLYKEHEDRFTAFLKKNAATAEIDGDIVIDRETLKKTLAKAQPDIVYLYCHAFPRTQLADGTWAGPNLGFGVENDQAAFIAATNLNGVNWQRQPLVFLNGCSTAAFNPYAPSPFVVQFVKTRRAGALIGTEVTVWEILAAEMAEKFFEAFLNNVAAGDALRRARRLLLRKNNPLGLVYTLYGRAELAL